MGDGFDQFVLGDAVLDCAAEVEAELFSVPAGGEDRDGDEASVSCGQFRSVPDVGEEDVIGEFGELRGGLLQVSLTRWFRPRVRPMD